MLAKRPEEAYRVPSVTSAGPSAVRAGSTKRVKAARRATSGLQRMAVSYGCALRFATKTPARAGQFPALRVRNADPTRYAPRRHRPAVGTRVAGRRRSIGLRQSEPLFG